MSDTTQQQIMTGLKVDLLQNASSVSFTIALRGYDQHLTAKIILQRMILAKMHVRECIRILRYSTTNNLDIPLDATSRFPCMWDGPKNAQNESIKIGNNLYKKVVIGPSETKYKIPKVVASEIFGNGFKIVLNDSNEAKKMEAFLNGAESDIYGTDAKVIYVEGRRIDLKYITEGIDQLYIDLIRNKKYFQLSEAERTILDIPIIQWRVKFYYGAYFLLYWLKGSALNRKVIHLTDQNKDELLMSSSLFKRKLREGIAEINNGTIYNNKAPKDTRDKLYAFIQNHANHGTLKRFTDTDLPDYGDYSGNINLFYQNLIVAEDCLASRVPPSLLQEDFVAAIASVGIRFYFLGDLYVHSDGKKATLGLTRVKWRIYDSFDFVGSQNLGDWQRDVFAPKYPQISLLAPMFGYTRVENKHFISFFKKTTGRPVNNDERTPYDFNIISRSYSEQVQIKKINYEIGIFSNSESVVK